MTLICGIDWSPEIRHIQDALACPDGAIVLFRPDPEAKLRFGARLSALVIARGLPSCIIRMGFVGLDT
jgi:hypothetical protein